MTRAMLSDERFREPYRHARDKAQRTMDDAAQLHTSTPSASSASRRISAALIAAAGSAVGLRELRAHIKRYLMPASPKLV